MKVARFVLKIVSLCLAAAYWDKIVAGIRYVGAKCGCKHCRPAEYDDYADWDE